MFYLLILAALLSVGLSSDETQSAASGIHGNIYGENENDNYHHDSAIRVIVPNYSEHDKKVPEIAQKIIQDTYSPIYYQPTRILDYRFLKSGGRDYTRGPGGQILILPKGIRSKEPKEYPDYDSLLDALTRKQKEEARLEHEKELNYERDLRFNRYRAEKELEPNKKYDEEDYRRYESEDRRQRQRIPYAQDEYRGSDHKFGAVSWREGLGDHRNEYH